MKQLLKQKFAAIALFALVISGLSFVASPVRAVETIASPASAVTVSVTRAISATPVVRVVGQTVMEEQSCSLPSLNSQTLVQDQAAINLNQPLNCFSLSVKPVAVSYTLNTEVVSAVSFGRIVVAPSHHNIAATQLHEPVHTAWALASLLPSVGTLRTSLLYVLYALLAAAALIAVSSLITQKQVSLAELCVRMC